MIWMFKCLIDFSNYLNSSPWAQLLSNLRKILACQCHRWLVNQKNGNEIEYEKFKTQKQSTHKKWNSVVALRKKLLDNAIDGSSIKRLEMKWNMKKMKNSKHKSSQLTKNETLLLLFERYCLTMPQMARQSKD